MSERDLVHTQPLIHSVTGSYTGVKRPQRLTIYFHLVPRLGLSAAVSTLALYAFMVWTRKILHIFFTDAIRNNTFNIQILCIFFQTVYLSPPYDSHTKQLLLLERAFI